MRGARYFTLWAILGAFQLTAAHATTVSYYLNQTNIDSSALVDGTSFALLTIDDDIAGSLRFTLAPLAPLTDLIGSNFGITEFAFNVIGTNPLRDSGTVAGQWTLPSGWTANVTPPPNQLDGFGRFDASVSTTGANRVSPLSFMINGTGLTLASFGELSSNNAGQGNVFFSAHIAGLNESAGATSGYFGGSITAVPLPAALPLLLSGFGLLGLLTGRRRA